MSDKSLFKPENILNADALEGKRDLLEELNLPPWLIVWLRLNQRLLIGIAVTVVVVLVGWSSYSQYAANREQQAAALLARAMEATEPAQRRPLLEEVVNDFGGTGPALWGRIELAHLAAAAGDREGAIKGYEAALAKVDERHPLAPLARYRLAGVLAADGQRERAVGLYRELSETPGFSGFGYLGLAEIHEQQGETEQAKAMYQKVLAAEEVSPLVRETAEQRLAR